MTQGATNLRAIVAVEPAQRVRCQQPNCGHSVYARIHIVEENGELLVLGSDCYAKRYEIASTTNFSGFGGGGGRSLTDAERELLQSNTAALLAKFEEELAQERARVELEQAQTAAKFEALRQAYEARQKQNVGAAQSNELKSWSSESDTDETSDQEPIALPEWAALKKPKSSFFAYGMEGGQCWVLMQSESHNGCFIAPAPVPFDGWDEALPLSIGIADQDRKVYVSQMIIDNLTPWFSGRSKKGSWIDSDAAAIQRFAEKVAAG